MYVRIWNTVRKLFFLIIFSILVLHYRWTFYPKFIFDETEKKTVVRNFLRISDGTIQPAAHLIWI